MEKQGKFFLGLDLGQSADYSALAILEQRFDGDGVHFDCRHLQRWPLRTSYPAIVADTAAIIARPELSAAVKAYDDMKLPHGCTRDEAMRRALQCALAIDATGVGAPVVDLFRHEQLNAEMYPIQITGGDTVTRDGNLTRVPKRDLVSAAQVALQTGRLKIAALLPDAAALTRELESFQVKINLDTAHDSYGAWREGSHDDLVLAVALALWIANNEIDHTMEMAGNYSYSR